MLNVMRRAANTWVIKMILVFIALSFVVWGVGDYVRKEGEEPVAEGGNWNIGPREYALAYENEFNQLKQRFGTGLDKKTAEVLGLKQRVLAGLINRHLLDSVTRRLRMEISPATLQNYLASNPAFLRGDRFDKERYQQWLRGQHMVARNYEAMLAEEIRSAQLYRTLATVVAVPDLLVQDSYQLENEKRVVEMLKLKIKALEPEIAVTDELLSTFLREHAERFMRLAQVQVEYVLLDGSMVREGIQIQPEEIKEYYEENGNEFRREERRSLSHILFQMTQESEQAQTMQRVEQAQARLQKGERFADVAREMSDDLSKSQGGALGEFTRETVDPALEGAAFSLAVGQLSAPIKSEYGYHLLQVTEIHPAEAKSLAQASEEIKGRLLEKKQQELVYERANKLEEKVVAAGNLQVVAEAMQLRYRQTGLFNREEVKGEEVEREEKFLDAAFATPVGEMSGLLEIKEGQFAVLKVLQRKEPELKTLEEAREAVTGLFKNERAHQKATELMQQAIALLRAGKSWQEAASVHPALRMEVSEPFTRGGGKGGPAPAVRMAAFRLSMENPLHKEALEGLEEMIAIRLQKVQEADAQVLQQALPTLRSSLENNLGQEQIIAFMNGLRNEAKVKVHNKVLERF
ncbi:SurA N-terminal domain-containing protein [Candidatus Magnetaquicoccus inordinatus]|uniref:SurA N-terminal domain-containing protein n=1 Tax=Candidatus Magnetaquicoccus inordinatus TaxID=2496818 RepID=UPI00187D4905|nr:SurA N-terminal domain-containing protein [Candidatus Magnetaquicoccus inordinatus]